MRFLGLQALSASCHAGHDACPANCLVVQERGFVRQLAAQLRALVGVHSEHLHCDAPGRGQPDHKRVTHLKMGINWLQVLGTTETPQIDQSVRHQFHSVMALLDMLETEE